MARFGMDNGYVIGPAENVFPALENFSEKVRVRCLLVWAKTKTEVFHVAESSTYTDNTGSDTWRSGGEWPVCAMESQSELKTHAQIES